MGIGLLAQGAGPSQGAPNGSWWSGRVEPDTARAIEGLSQTATPYCAARPDDVYQAQPAAKSKLGSRCCHQSCQNVDAVPLRAFTPTAGVPGPLCSWFSRSRCLRAEIPTQALEVDRVPSCHRAHDGPLLLPSHPRCMGLCLLPGPRTHRRGAVRAGSHPMKGSCEGIPP